MPRAPDAVRPAVDQGSPRAGFPPQMVYELQLVVSEACSNAIKHAYGMEKGHAVELSADIDDGGIRLVVKDLGEKLDPCAYPEPDPENPSETRYGMYILRQLMDKVRIDASLGKGTTLTMVKRKPGTRSD